MKDPIYNSKAVLAKLEEQCVGVTIKELDAGNIILFVLFSY